MSEQLYMVILRSSEMVTRNLHTSDFASADEWLRPVLHLCRAVTGDLRRRYQLMETADRALLDEWMANWSDLVEFEVHAVMSSQAAAAQVARL